MTAALEVGIHQVVAGASPGDAITSYALEIRDLLRTVCRSEIYARHIAPGVAHEVRPLEEYDPRHSRNVLVHHASIGEPLVHAFLLSRREPIVLVYHNVTPARYFERWDRAFAELLELGRSELHELRHRVVLAIADSTFNAAELEAIGYSNVVVSRPIIDAHRLTRVRPDGPTSHHLTEALDAPYVLFVGQLLPHKRPDLLVEAAHIASTYLHAEPFVMFVGHARLSAYTEVIVEQIRELNLPRVHVVGSVSDAQLAAFYAHARAVVTASEHEGFCVPLVEAMAFGVPIVARGCGAIPETLDGGGLVLPPEAGAALLAESLATVTRDDRLRAELARLGQERLATLRDRHPRSELVGALLEVV